MKRYIVLRGPVCPNGRTPVLHEGAEFSMAPTNPWLVKALRSKRVELIVVTK